MKTENKKTALRGTVLFTVVAVMALLIIFLTSTLALASASGNRAHKSYASSQASYTARAAIDSFAEAMVRNEGIEAAIQNMGSDPSASAIHPKVEIGDLSLGQIGYYDASGNWVPDRIEITPLENSTSYAFYDKEGTGPDWYPVESVKITVTCRVGKEEETVSAYIRKSASSASTQVGTGEVKGLQEAGGNEFFNGAEIYGGLGVGLSDASPQGFHYHNQLHINTSLNFFNASLCAATSTFDIHVQKPVKAPGDASPAAMPYSETVITGYYMGENDTAVNLDYTVGAGDVFAIKDTPYFYVDQLLTAPKGTSSQLNLVQAKGNSEKNNVSPPFNIFAGTIYVPDAAFKSQADLYLMDEYDTSTKYDAEYYNKEGQAEPAHDVRDVVKGNNVIGKKDGGQHALYTWAGSVVNKNEQGSGNSSTGGNIYCNGNLTLYRTHVNGDVRVMGDLYVGDSVSIDGNLVVRGEIHKLEGQNPTVGGTIYNGTGGGGGVNPGYTYHDNELRPDYDEVPNVKYDNNPVPNVVEETDSAGNKVYKILDPDGNGTVYDSVPYYQTIIIDPMTGTAGDDPNTIVTESVARFKSIRLEDGIVPLDENGNVVPTTDIYTYYDSHGHEVSRSEAVGSYWTDAAGNEVPDSEAIAPVVAGLTPSYAAYVAQTHQEAYPQSMTREKIYGEYKDVNGEHKFVPADESTKIITTLQEARKALNMDPIDGTYNATVYLTDLPAGVTAPAWDGSDTITSSCTIGAGKTDKEITIDTTDAIWIVLNGCEINKDIVVKCDAAGKHGTVNFLIKGKVTLSSNAAIRTSEITRTGTPVVTYMKDFGIIYYAGGPNPILSLDGSNSLLCGSFKAPELLLIATEGGPIEVKYTDEFGNQKNVKPVILGNALVKKVVRTEAEDPNNVYAAHQNEFKVIYTKSGTGGSAAGGVSIRGKNAYWELGYLAGA